MHLLTDSRSIKGIKHWIHYQKLFQREGDEIESSYFLEGIRLIRISASKVNVDETYCVFDAEVCRTSGVS